ncbi:MAG: hypothetical protein EXS05_02135 [Planctomycetaceae bacterium]|nr:hypothetical protein [Planctomycetaceae bacterium]
MLVRAAARVYSFSLPLVAAGLLLTAGCESQTPAPKKGVTAPPGTKAGEEHDHGPHHHHAEKGPHGGALVAIGDDVAHLEVVLDAETGKVTAYILDGEAANPVPIKAKSLELTFVREAAHDHDHEDEGEEHADDHDDDEVTGAVVLEAVTPDPNGMATEFAGVVEGLKGADEFDAVLTTFSVAGKEFKQVKFSYPEGNEHDHHHH